MVGGVGGGGRSVRRKEVIEVVYYANNAMYPAAAIKDHHKGARICRESNSERPIPREDRAN